MRTLEHPGCELRAGPPDVVGPDVVPAQVTCQPLGLPRSALQAAVLGRIDFAHRTRIEIDPDPPRASDSQPDHLGPAARPDWQVAPATVVPPWSGSFGKESWVNRARPTVGMAAVTLYVTDPLCRIAGSASRAPAHDARSPSWNSGAASWMRSSRRCPRRTAGPMSGGLDSLSSRSDRRPPRSTRVGMQPRQFPRRACGTLAARGVPS
jgi:hypothetical protein